MSEVTARVRRVVAPKAVDPVDDEQVEAGGAEVEGDGEDVEQQDEETKPEPPVAKAAPVVNRVKNPAAPAAKKSTAGKAAAPAAAADDEEDLEVLFPSVPLPDMDDERNTSAAPVLMAMEAYRESKAAIQKNYAAGPVEFSGLTVMARPGGSVAPVDAAMAGLLLGWPDAKTGKYTAPIGRVETSKAPTTVAEMQASLAKPPEAPKKAANNGWYTFNQRSYYKLPGSTLVVYTKFIKDKHVPFFSTTVNVETCRKAGGGASLDAFLMLDPEFLAHTVAVTLVNASGEPIPPKVGFGGNNFQITYTLADGDQTRDIDFNEYRAEMASNVVSIVLTRSFTPSEKSNDHICKIDKDAKTINGRKPAKMANIAIVQGGHFVSPGELGRRVDWTAAIQKRLDLIASGAENSNLTAVGLQMKGVAHIGASYFTVNAGVEPGKANISYKGLTLLGFDVHCEMYKAVMFTPVSMGNSSIDSAAQLAAASTCAPGTTKEALSAIYGEDDDE